MVKKINSKHSVIKNRRTVLQKNICDISTTLLNPLLKNITSKINSINEYYSISIKQSFNYDYSPLYYKDSDTTSTYEETFSQVTTANFFQNDRDLFIFQAPSDICHSNEDELEKIILSQVLTPTNTIYRDSPSSYRQYDEIDKDEDINFYKVDSVDEDNKRLEMKGRDLMNKIKIILIQLEDNHISLGYLFRNLNQTYAIIDQQTKTLLIDLTAVYDIQFLSRLFNISKKSILRWKRKGTIRKKGAGRKISDPQMEEKVIHWYNVNRKKIKMTSKIIKQKAIEFSQVKSFQASKGWFEKFKKKYKLIINNIYGHSRRK